MKNMYGFCTNNANACNIIYAILIILIIRTKHSPLELCAELNVHVFVIDAGEEEYLKHLFFLLFL